MSFMPRESHQQNMNLMHRFMDVRESVAAAPALPQSVQAFLKLDSKDTGNTTLKDTLDSGAIVVGADAELRRAGYGSPEHSRLAEDGETVRGTDLKSRQEEKERKDRAAIDFIRQQQEMHQRLVAEVQSYAKEFEEAQFEATAARERLEEAQTNREAAEQRKDVASENASQVSQEAAMAIRDTETLTVQVDGKTVRLNGSGGYVDEQGNLIDAQTVAEQAKGPAADALAQAAAMTEARAMLRRNQSNAEQALQAANEKAEAAAAEALEKSQIEQQAAQKLQEAEEKLESFEDENPGVSPKPVVSAKPDGGTFLSGTAEKDVAVPIAPSMSTQPEEYDAKRNERIEATRTSGFVGGERIEISKLSLGGHFRTATTNVESAAPEQSQTPQIGSEIAGIEANRYTSRTPSALSAPIA